MTGNRFTLQSMLMAAITDGLQTLLGLELKPEQLSLLQISCRTVTVFAVAIAIARFADKRFLARLTAFDAIVAFMLGSMLSRAINGSAPLLPTFGGGLVLVLIHRWIALLARRSHWVSQLVKGQSEVVIQDGTVDEEALRRNHLSPEDLLEELRMEGQTESPETVRRATVERSGHVSVIPKARD